MTHPDPTQKANLLFYMLDKFPLEGYEASFKMLPHAFLKVRFLIGIQTKHINKNRFDEICMKMEMPNACYKLCLEKLTQSNIILFGFEEEGNQCTYKLYLEFSEKNRSIVYQTKSKQPLLQYLGFKWNAFDHQKYIITAYKWFPLISIDHLMDRLGQLYKPSKQFPLFLIEDLIQMAIRDIDDSGDPFIYLEATDMNSERTSFDLNLYKAGITLGDINQFILKTMQFFEIDARKWNAFLGKIRSKVLGHISGGHSSSRDQFLSVYYDVFSEHS
jgi:hypothetical protein